MVFNILAWIGDDRDGTKKIDIGKPSLVVFEKAFFVSGNTIKVSDYELFRVWNR